MISITPCSSNDPFQKLEEAGIPVIFFDKVPEVKTCNKVCLADEEAAIFAASTIIKYNKKQVPDVFGNHELSITQKRLHAFAREFEKQAPDTKLFIRHCNNSTEALNVTLDFCSRNTVDNIFAMSD